MWNPIKSPLIVRTTCLQSRHESWRRRVGPERKRGKRFLSVTPPHSHPQHTLSGWLSLCLFLCLRHKSFDHQIIKQSPRCKYCICVCAWERHRERERKISHLKPWMFPWLKKTLPGISLPGKYFLILQDQAICYHSVLTYVCSKTHWFVH